jgi:hypothetical protein
MQHFFKKNFQIFGAGGPKKPDAPPPPVLKPPKLGDLQAISSYEYVENIDLISDGVIDGFVSQNGEYVDDLRIFESVYLQDVPIRQSMDLNQNSIRYSFDLSFVNTGVSGLFYPSGFSSGFAPVAPTGLTGISGVTGGVSYNFIVGRDVIAQDILNTLNTIPRSSGVNDVYFQQFENLRSKYNFDTKSLVKNYLLPTIPTIDDNNYPYFAVKLSFSYGFDTGAARPFNYNRDVFVNVQGDISNHAYIPLEADELQKQRQIEAPKKINLTYFTNSNAAEGIQQDYLTGSMYLFLAQNITGNNGEGFVYQNSADALINYLTGLDVVAPISKFNYGNASVEIRNGTENQRPLSLFKKTYIDQSYGQILRGPYKKSLPILAIARQQTAGGQLIETDFTATGALTASGLIDPGLFGDLVNYDIIESSHSALFEQATTEEASELLNNNKNYRFDGLGTINQSSKDYFEIRWKKTQGRYAFLVTVLLEKKTSKNELSYFAPTWKVYNSKSGGGFGTQNLEIFDPSGSTVVINNLNKIKQKISYSSGGIVFSADRYEIAAVLRASLDIIENGDGSNDKRLTDKTTTTNFSDWNQEYVAYVEEKAVPIVHAINNPNVNQVFVTIGVRVLRDTAEKSILLRSTNPDNNRFTSTKIEPGNPFPSLVRFKIEAGTQDRLGNESVTWSANYQIKGYAESQATIDIGREENLVDAQGKSVLEKYNRFILGTQNIATPIQLPEPQSGQTRFVKITRLTSESYSSLIKREISLEKVSEIINVPFSYPFSAVCGLKLDARTLSQIPSRSYDARFKKVFVPSNYFPLKINGKDKRYLTVSEAAAFNNLPADSLDRIIYQGNWDGTFKLAWTDNPVWILFDLFINRRYGLGNFIAPEQVNYWELYKIGRFCDAVDEDGKFVGVPAADGGLEPRYGFNGVIADKTNVFDALKSIVSSFRGNMFYTNSEINFTNDRLKPIMAFFNNANVKDGFFNYNNDRRDLKYNVIEVSYLDRDDLFKEKVEYVEDPDDIKVRGILRTSTQTFGVTSRAHAKRIGEHILYSTINEDQNVAFVASNEILLCRPGDLISVNDEVKTLKRHVGRVIDVDTGKYILSTNISLSSNDFSSSGLTPELTVLIPTGKYQSSDFYDLAKSPSKLNIADLYQTDVPVAVSFPATGTGLLDSPTPISYGSMFYINPASSGISLFSEIKIGSPCSITVSNLQQDIYKIQSIKEINLNEYEVIASKFDTGKFAEIEASETLDDYFQFYNSDRQTQVNEGFGYNVYNENKYQITGIPQIQFFSTGEFAGSSSFTDISGSWLPVENADSYTVKILQYDQRGASITRFNGTIAGTSIILTGGLSTRYSNPKNTYSLSVTPKKTGVFPNLIGPESAISSFYVAPEIVQNNASVSFLSISQ